MDQSTLIFVGICLLFVLSFIWRHRRRKTSGEMGEIVVAKRLKKLDKEKYHVINNLLLQNNGYSSQIDHVVVSVYGVFVIETKNFSGDIYGGPNSEMWTQNIYGSKSQFMNPIQQNQGHITALKKTLGDNIRVPFYNIVLFSEYADVKADACKGVYYFHQIIHVIEGYSEEVMSQDLVDRIYEKLLSVNVSDKKARKAHIKSARDTKLRRDIAVASGKCPRCGGELVLRNGKYGKFYGCSNYPKCKYTHQ